MSFPNRRAPVSRHPRPDALSVECDMLLAGMQKPASKKGMQAAFNAAPKTLARAAVKAARRR
jgi:hypothetical protein